MLKGILYTLLLCIAAVQVHAQQVQPVDTPTTLKNPDKYIDAVAGKAASIEAKLDKKTEKALAQLRREEAKLIKQLHKLDSSKAKMMLQNAQGAYADLEEKLKTPGKLQSYIPWIDSAGTSLNFIGQNSPLMEKAKEYQHKARDALSKVEALKAQLQKAENLKQFLKERKQYLKQQLEKFGFAKQLKKINKQAYYYAQQIKEYKDILNDPKKIEKKALELLSKTKIWKEFFRKNSLLASMFRMPGDPNDPMAQANLAGLQTRAQVNNLIQTQIASGGPNAQAQFQQNLQAAQSQLNQLKDKIIKAGGGSSDAEMPEGFKPNNQKTKSFWQRLELGTNIQNQRASGILPTTSDLSLSVGYKPNDKSIIGIGSSFKLGWNQPGSRRIQFSGQGVSLRSFIDYKLKGSFWISGGYEMNYRSELGNITALNDYSAWQQSGLIGVSKVVAVKSKLFKKTKLILLFDFMSYQQVPRTQPLVFRIGYNF